MTNTPSLTLPLLMPSQAQKHVTVNEALVRLDGLTQLRLQSRQLASPPAGNVVDGDCYAVASGASGAWLGMDGRIAVGSNGGWIFVQPLSGWRAWIEDEHCLAVLADGQWKAGWIGGTSAGAASMIKVYEAEVAIGSGATVDLPLSIPKDSMVFACSARVVDAMTGSLTSWKLGISGAAAKFGAGLGLAAGSYCTGILSQPTTYYADTPLQVTATGGTLTGGTLRLALHCYSIELPS